VAGHQFRTRGSLTCIGGPRPTPSLLSHSRNTRSLACLIDAECIHLRARRHPHITYTVIPVLKQVSRHQHRTRGSLTCLGGPRPTGRHLQCRQTLATFGSLACLIDAEFIHLRDRRHPHITYTVIPVLKQVSRHQHRTRGSLTCLGGPRPTPSPLAHSRNIRVVSMLNRRRIHSFQRQKAPTHHVWGDSGAKTSLMSESACRGSSAPGATKRPIGGKATSPRRDLTELRCSSSFLSARASFQGVVHGRANAAFHLAEPPPQ
jgi:hypothetical protein